MEMKKIIILTLLIALSACAKTPEVEEVTTLPKKTFPSSMLLSDSDIYPANLDEYLFLDDVLYVDTRDHLQFIEEGSVAGFVNIPFYDVLVCVNEDDNGLFLMKKVEADGKVYRLGEPGSFVPKYEESEAIIEALFPKDLDIVVLSTAGVESTYLLNLLVQLGYDHSSLYNAGGYSNSAVGFTSYRELKEAKYRVNNLDLADLKVAFSWENLTPIED